MNHMNEFVNYVTPIILKVNIILYASAVYMGRYGKFYFNMPLQKTLLLMACRTLPDKFVYFMKDCQMEVFKYISEAWTIRQLTI